MLTLILASALAMKFPGGTPNDFINLLSDTTKQNVVLNLGEGRAFGSADLNTDDLTELARGIRAQLKIAMLPGQDLIFSDQMLSRNLVSGPIMRGAAETEAIVRAVKAKQDARAGLLPKPPELTEMPLSLSGVGLSADAVKDGKVTFKTEKSQRLDLPALSGAFSKPLKMHWIYNDAILCVRVQDMPELDFLKFVAKATGSILVSTAKDYTLALDPIEIRKRAIATMQKTTPTQGNAIAEKSLQFRIACLNGLTGAQLGEALKSDGAEVRVDLGQRSPLASLALQRIHDLEQYDANLPADSPAPRRATGLLQRIDRSRSAYLIVNSYFQTEIEVPIVDRNGRPNGIVRLQ
jgi:hypothetical protein